MVSVVPSLVAVVLLLAANGFFVAAEFALVKARAVRIEGRAGEGSASAVLTMRIMGNLEAYLAACQLGITMASLGLGWVGEPAVEAMVRPLLQPLELSDATLHTISFLIGFLLFSSLHIVVGEQVPKTYAIRKAEPVSMLLAYPLQAFYLASYPLNWLLNWMSRRILSAMGVSEAGHGDVYSQEELRDLIHVSTDHGHLEQAKAEMLHNLFKFDQRPVERIMLPRAEADVLNLQADEAELARAIAETPHSRLPLVDGGWDHLEGVVLVKELLAAMIAGDAAPWRDLRRFVRKPLIVPESQKVSKLFEVMRAERAHMAFVLDEYGEFSGLVTMEDLIEEIVGDISDELDLIHEGEAIVETAEGWVAEGLTPLADIERATGCHFEPGLDVNTLSGVFMKRLERMPEVGDELEEAGLRMRVAALEGRRVDKVELTRIPEPAETPPATPVEGTDPAAPGG